MIIITIILVWLYFRLLRELAVFQVLRELAVFQVVTRAGCISGCYASWLYFRLLRELAVFQDEDQKVRFEWLISELAVFQVTQIQPKDREELSYPQLCVDTSSSERKFLQLWPRGVYCAWLCSFSSLVTPPSLKTRRTNRSDYLKTSRKDKRDYFNRKQQMKNCVWREIRWKRVENSQRCFNKALFSGKKISTVCLPPLQVVFAITQGPS